MPTYTTRAKTFRSSIHNLLKKIKEEKRDLWNGFKYCDIFDIDLENDFEHKTRVVFFKVRTRNEDNCPIIKQNICVRIYNVEFNGYDKKIMSYEVDESLSIDTFDVY